MPDPIASGSTRKQESSYDDAVCREEPTPAVAAPAKTNTKEAARPEATPGPLSHEEIIAQLPSRPFDYSLMARPTTKPVPSPLPTNTNAERTTAREGVAPYAAAGLTSSGDANFAAVALLKGRNSQSGVEAEVVSASVQFGFQSEAQVGLLRVGASRDDGTSSGTVDALSARAAIGIHNTDGSTGFNIALTATALGVEGTHRGSHHSVTGGVSLGVGGEASIGVRDADHDGKKEVCLRVGGGPATIGHCLEMPW